MLLVINIVILLIIFILGVSDSRFKEKNINHMMFTFCIPIAASISYGLIGSLLNAVVMSLVLIYFVFSRK